jgi:N-acetylglutamate synthase-like GNAT family acetyltransferase
VLAQQIHNLIEPFVKKDIILPRSVQDINNSINEFVIIKNNSKLVACCGVRKHKNINELYCLAVDTKFHNKGLSQQILQKIELQTTGNLLALSKHQGNWFLKNNFVELSVDLLPKNIQYNTDRKSKIFIKYRK